MAEQSPETGHVGAPNGETEITPEMIRAGLSEIWMNAELHPAADEVEVMGRVFRAMVRARCAQEMPDTQHERQD